MKKQLLLRAAVILLMTVLCHLQHARSQAPDTSLFKPHGHLSGYMFGDYYYKAHADSLNRGGSNQYTGIPAGRNAFQFRRIYLGYDYAISPTFSAQLLLAAEDARNATRDGKYTFYIKYANLRWKNIFPRADLVIGQTATPAFSHVSDKIWSYRSVERTITDIRRMPSYDFGLALEGTFDEEGNYGYNLMAGNGSGASPEADKYKRFYGEAYAKFFQQKLVLDIFADYGRESWQPGFHHAQSMLKGFIAYTTPAITIGTEAFVNHLQDGEAVAPVNNPLGADTVSGRAIGISTFVRGRLVKDKLGFFARWDYFNPNTRYDGSGKSSYTGLSAHYDPDNREQFITAGLDITPVKNVHFIPNIWYNSYTNQVDNLSGSLHRDYDLVYRLTFYFIYK